MSSLEYVKRYIREGDLRAAAKEWSKLRKNLFTAEDIKQLAEEVSRLPEVHIARLMLRDLLFRVRELKEGAQEGLRWARHELWLRSPDLASSPVLGLREEEVKLGKLEEELAAHPLLVEEDRITDMLEKGEISDLQAELWFRRAYNYYGRPLEEFGSLFGGLELSRRSPLWIKLMERRQKV